MDINEQIEFYEAANETLKLLSKDIQILKYHIEDISPKYAQRIFHEFIKIGAATSNDGVFTLIKTQKADDMLIEQYYEEKISDLKKKKKKCVVNLNSATL